MILNRDELRAVCFEVARETMHEKRPVDVGLIQDLADQFFRGAADYEDFVAGQNRDPNLIIRAVRYLLSRHAIPPMRDDTRWFGDMLDALLELACPNTIADPEDDAFFRDIETGLAIARSSFGAVS